MKNNINIRLLKQTDYEDFMQMSVAFFDMPCCDHQIETKNFDSTFHHCLKSSTYYTVLILEYDGNIAGFCSLAFSYSTEAGGHTVDFDDIYIKDEYQGLGIGHRLFDFVYANYPAKRYRLEATADNQRAIKLYQKLGFVFLNYLQLIKDVD